MKMKHEDFQKKAMQMLLAGSDEVLRGLRDQYANATSQPVEFTGAGFYTNFFVKSGTPPVADGKTFQIDDVEVILNGKRSAVGIILFVNDGILSMLEGYTLTAEEWPNEYKKIEFTYRGNANTRDISTLRKIWA
jgi:hypothetical protein